MNYSTKITGIGALAALLIWPNLPVMAAPAPAKTATATAPVKPADPLDIPAFAPIPNEFVFAGTQKDIRKLLERYTGGLSLDTIPDAKDLKPEENNESVQLLRDVRDVIAPIHVVRVRSISFYASSEDAHDEAIEALKSKTEAPKTEAPTDNIANPPSLAPDNSGYEREQELLKNAEKFYDELFIKQGGKIQTRLRGETSLAVYKFDQPRTFAVVTRGPSRVIVARADGKPDVGAITKIFQTIVSMN